MKLHELTNDDLTLDDLVNYFYTLYPKNEDVVYEAYFKTLKELEISDVVGEEILLQLKRKINALRMSEQAFKASQGVIPFEELYSLYEKELTTVDHKTALDIEPVTDDLEQLLHDTYTEEGYRWRLECLNRSLGSLRAGDFGFIFARPETGKTTLLASEGSHFLKSSKRKPIIWFNNEEQGHKVKLRIYQAYFGVTIDVLLSNPKKYYQRFKEETGGLLKLFDDATLTRHQIESIISKLDPGLVIYDQLPKIKGFSGERDDLRLGTIFQWARELAKSGHAAIGVCQADGQAEGIRYLTMEHVANAKTAVQAEADWMLGIGKSHDTGAEFVRYLNISKNKLIGDQDSNPDLKHGRFETLIRPQTARYEDVIKYN